MTEKLSFKTILLVEDHAPQIEDIYSGLLAGGYTEENGYRIVRDLTTEAEVFAAFEEHQDSIVLIILDAQLAKKPNANSKHSALNYDWGGPVLTQIKNAGYTIPPTIAHSSDHDYNKGLMSYGATHMVRKIYEDQSALLDVIREILTPTLPKILLVEDQEFLIERLTESLVFAGYDVTHVDCANHAMRAIDQRVEGSQVFDCIVLDYYLHESKAWPDSMDGTFVLKNLKYGGPERLGLEKLPPVIAHSSDEEKGDEMLELGATAYVKKGAGISDEALVAKIEELLAAV